MYEPCPTAAQNMHSKVEHIVNITSDIENLDLITTNRLRLGRNNNQSSTGPLLITSNPKSFLQDNEDILDVL